VTSIYETACKETKWHIARLLKTTTKTCFSQQAITKKKYKAKIIQANRAMATSTYTGVMLETPTFIRKRKKLWSFSSAMMI
jgi:hypothetical protein